MKTDEERKGKIKTFKAIKKPTEITVFQFTEDMLPEVRKELFKISFSANYYIVSPLIKWIYFKVWLDRDIQCYLLVGDTYSKKFKVGDYIAEEEGNYFVITREEFREKWVRK